MKIVIKLVVVGIFALLGFAMLVNAGLNPNSGYFVSAQEATPTPTPPANTMVNSDVNMNSNVADSNANTANANVATANANTANANISTGDRKIPSEFTLGLDSISEYGEVPFNHDNHAFKNYSPDGKSVISCVECHHTDQPKSAMKPPLVTSERDVALTMDLYRTSTFKVSNCRVCHFQEGAVPDGKEMATAIFEKDGKTETKEYNNEIAYHLNCNICHDEAAKLRPEVKKSAGFATTRDCNICHITQ